MKISSRLEVLIGNANDNIKCMRRDDKIRFSRFFSVGASSWVTTVRLLTSNLDGITGHRRRNFFQ